jgi:hypothetical protein
LTVSSSPTAMWSTPAVAIVCVPPSPIRRGRTAAYASAGVEGSS